VQCVILAGGRGLRMRPLTVDTPKALLPVAGQPFAAHQLRWIADHGVDRVVYCIGELGDQIRAFVGDGARFGLGVAYVDDGVPLRGTAGALRRALDAGALDDRFLVLYGDSYLPIDFAAVWGAFLAQPRPALMTVLRHDPAWEVGNVEYADGVVRAYRKSQVDTGMPYVDYGLSAYTRDCIADLVPRDTPTDLAVVQTRLASDGQLAGYEVHQRFYEVGSPAGLQDLERWLTNAG
jgi:MurNAc alpha-1-phosphate uridylyltransferase